MTAGGLATDYDVLIGKKSIGSFLEKEGFAALPGPTIPTPGNYYLERVYYMFVIHVQMFPTALRIALF